MRLLNKVTLEFEWFLQEKVPAYIILSHRWTGNETTMKEFMEQKTRNPDRQSQGTKKVTRFCKKALEYSSDYVWMDTICIDKTSSTELQEAINSMYKWYERASLCIVYMEDVNIDSAASLAEQLVESRWFTRGWTLQELLAPVEELFLDVKWRHIGARDELSNTIQDITRIPTDCLGNRSRIHETTVAQRMSWMSLRQTTRTEDMAYCLLGIFDVNMGMLYGEGHKAFIRLQKEIIRAIDDETLFLWLAPEGQFPEIPVLAPTPSCFAICRDLEIKTEMIWRRQPCQTTARGLAVELYGTRSTQAASESFEVVLNCTVAGKCAYFVIRRSRNESLAGINRWHRVASKEIQTAEMHRVLSFAPPLPMTGYHINTEFTGVQRHGQQQMGHRAQHGMMPEEKKEPFTVYIY